jgi:hypothetical protein
MTIVTPELRVEEHSTVSARAPCSRQNARRSVGVAARAYERYAALAIIMCATLLCMFWAVRVPMFQEPDEIAHADASFAYFNAGGPFVAEDPRAENFVTPQARYLVRAVGYRKLRYDNHAVVPKGYGTRAFFRSVDANAPGPIATPPHAGEALPYALALYPSPYYIAIGMAMHAAWSAFGRSVSTAFFAGRLVNVALFSANLVLAYLVLLGMRFTPIQRLLLLGAVAFFPLSTWMGAYIQPDNSSALLMTASLLGAIALRRHPASFPVLVAFGLAEAALGVTKLQYALVSIVALGLALRNVFDGYPVAVRLRALLLGVVLPLATAYAGRYLSPFGVLGTPPSGMAYEHMSAIETLRTAASDGIHSITDAYFGGEAFQSFWYHFGIRSAGAFSGGAAYTATAVLVFVTILAFFAWIARQIEIVRSLRGVVARYGFGRALVFVGTDPVMNLYVVLSALLFTLYAFTGGYLTLQGRYWYPVLVPIVILSVQTIGRSVPRRHARRATTLACACWLCYAVVSAPAAVIAMERGFYDARYVVPNFELGQVESIAFDGRTRTDLTNLRIPEGVLASVRGSVLDTSLGLPAGDVRFRLDGGPARSARTHVPDRALWIVFNDQRLANGGFTFDFSTNGLKPGVHELSIAAYEARAPYGLPVEEIRFVVTPGSRD